MLTGFTIILLIVAIGGIRFICTGDYEIGFALFYVASVVIGINVTRMVCTGAN